MSIESKLLTLYIFVFIILWNASFCFNVNFHESYDAKIDPFNTQIYKREMSQFFDKASYSFNGFEKIESIPVLFPIDICILNLEGVKYAASLHRNKNGVRHFAVYKMNNETYELLADIPTPIATAMDCKAIGAKGYVAIAFNITTPIERAKDGSPIYEIAGDRLRAVQYFASPNLVSVYLRLTGNDFFLLQTFENTQATPNLYCPYFIWSGSTFNKMGRIPCSNARHLEPFAIDYESFVAVANYADQRGRTLTYSEIYKFSKEKKKFQMFQKIKTSGAVDVQYFNVPFDESRRQHFLVFGNSISTESVSKAEKIKREGKNLEADSIFYLFDKGQFVPYQRLSLYAVEQFLPVQNNDAEKFLLLVACSNQDIKIYNLNDWKFEESEAQFTEGALGRGVANMRIFQNNEDSYLVIANELMADNETNIFLPIFKQDEHANALRQQIIDWTKDNMERLTNIDVDKLKEDVEAKLLSHQQNKAPIEVTNIPSSNIQTVITKSLVYPRLHLGTNYWKALSYANQALDALQNLYKSRQSQKREKRQSDTLAKGAYEFEEINVGTLVVHEKLQAKRVNGIAANKPEFESIKAKKIVVTGSYKGPGNTEDDLERITPEIQDSNDGDVLNVENLQVSGKLNEFTWNDLMNNTLKRAGVQFIKAAATINDLKAETVLVSNDEISGHNLNKLISINDDGNYVVHQDIHFAAPVTAKNVVINERLNNIHVYQRKFDVLLKRSNETQIVDGAKRLERVKVLEPVTIAGKMLGSHLKSISPTKALHDTIILNGDYTIMGDVTISKQLTTNDIIDSNTNISVKNSLENAIRLVEPLEDVNIRFQQPLEVNNSLVSFINAQDLQQLVPTNIDQIQVVEGEKIFKNSLEIRKGFSEVKNLNGIDVEKLEKRLLLKNTNQSIKVPMHLGKIVAKGLYSPALQLNSKNLSTYLTKSGDQFIPGTLNVHQLTAQTVNVENLNANANIFNAQLNEIYQQKSKSAPNVNIFQPNRKFHGSIYVKNLKINSTINSKTVDEIERLLTQLEGNIKYVGNIKFNYDMNITNLTFYGNFNGIPAKEFGRCWLQKQGVQSFTVPQTLLAVSCEKDLILKGKLNGVQMDEFFTNTYWINRKEHINEVVFENPIQMQGGLNSKTINGLHIPQDILYRSSLQPQVLYGNLFVQTNLNVSGHIVNVTSINGLNLEQFNNFLNGYIDTQTLYVEHANFVSVPFYKTLNHHDLKSMLDVVWLANENVNLQHHVEISEGYFEGLLEFEGPINNMNLKYLKDNYFSLSQPQDISTELIFTNDVKFEHDLNAEDFHLFGNIIETNSRTPFNFDTFVANTLKTAGPHEITGTWSILEAIIPGDLNNVEINGLNLANDVVLLDTPLTDITATKRLQAATIKKLYASPLATINAVDVSQWIRDAVYLYENYTILGVTTIDTINLYNDLLVAGLVNDIPFDDTNLMLRDHDQILGGSMIIRNHFPEKQKILANNFENLQVLRLNDWNVEEFLAGQLKQTSAEHVKVQSHLIFTQPLVVSEYRSNEGIFSGPKWKRRAIDNETSEDWLMLENAVQKLKKSFEVPFYILDHFEIRQTLPLAASELTPLTLRFKGAFLDVIGLSNETGENLLKYYRWDVRKQQFVSDENLSWLPQEKTLIDILKLAFENAEYLSIEKPPSNLTFYSNIISHKTEGLQEVLQLKSQLRNGQIEAFEMQNEDCFAVYGGNSSLSVPIYCLKLNEEEQPTLKIYQKETIQRSNVQQIVPLSNESIALLFANAVEIWSTGSDLKLQQRLALVHPKQFTVGAYNDVIFLAVLSEIQPLSLHHGSVEIYSSRNSSFHFEHLQTLDCIEPQQIAFSSLKKSNDLVLHILTASADQPLAIFQYKGVMGFEKIVGASTLPSSAKRLKIVELKVAKQNLIALLGEEEITLMEIVLKKI